MADTQRLRATPSTRSTEAQLVGILLRSAIVGLTLATGAIHLSLGGILFTLNGIGYVVAAAAMVAPLGLAARFRWLVRLGLIGYAATTIVGWYLMGPRYETAYVAKAIEVALIVLLGVEFRRIDGNPIVVLRAAAADLIRFARRLMAR